MNETGVARFPLGRSIGLFLVAALVALGAMVVDAVVTGILAAIHGDQQTVAGAFKNPASIAFQTMEIVGYLTMAAFILWRYPRITGRSLRELGFRALRASDWKVVAAAAGVLLGLRVVLVLVLALTHQTKHTQAGFEHVHVTANASAVMFALTLVVVAPFAEELLFRMVLFGSLSQRIPMLWAAATSALLFGLVHGDLVLFPFIAVLGFVNALVYRRTSNIGAAMIVHGLNNLLPTLAYIFTG